jgi:hypothetical protein
LVTKKAHANDSGAQLRPKTASVGILGKNESLQIVVQQDKQSKGVKMQGKRAAATAVEFDLKSENPYGQLQPAAADRQQQITQKNSRNEQKRRTQRTEYQDWPKKSGTWHQHAKSDQYNRSLEQADGRSSSRARKEGQIQDTFDLQPRVNPSNMLSSNADETAEMRPKNDKKVTRHDAVVRPKHGEGIDLVARDDNTDFDNSSAQRAINIFTKKRRDRGEDAETPAASTARPSCPAAPS